MHHLHKSSILAKIYAAMSESANFSYARLGNALKVIRQLRGYKQEYVSARLGIHQTQYSRFESNQLHIDIETFLQVCEVLEISPLLLLYCAGYAAAYPLNIKLEEEKVILELVLERMNSSGGG